MVGGAGFLILLRIARLSKGPISNHFLTKTISFFYMNTFCKAAFNMIASLPGSMDGTKLDL